MFKIKKLEELKKQIINKLITPKSLDETKNKEMLKGDFLKQFFKYVFFKPMYIDEKKSKMDEVFAESDGLNIYKCINLLVFSTASCIGVAGVLIEKSIVPILLSLAGFLILALLSMIISRTDWAIENRKTKKKFNVNNIEDIKKNLLENYTDPQIRNLLKENLNKEELTDIMTKLEKLIGKDEILSCFEKVRKINNDEEIFDDISKPYVLVKLIEKLILDEKQKEKEEKSNKKEIKEFNSKIIDSFINNGNKNNSNEIENYNKEKLPEVLKV